MENEAARPEHHWLLQLLGDWDYVSECDMGPGQPPMTMQGRASVRALGDLWVTIDAGNADWRSLMTLGFDAQAGRFVGNFVGSTMTYQWVYAGGFDETGTTVVLDTVGPRFGSPGHTAYQDLIGQPGDGGWTLHSRILGDDGVWKPFMAAQYRRAGTG